MLSTYPLPNSDSFAYIVLHLIGSMLPLGMNIHYSFKFNSLSTPFECKSKLLITLKHNIIYSFFLKTNLNMKKSKI